MSFFHKWKVPLVLQMEAVECGAAALTMILRYYGKMLPLDQVRIACGVSRDGSNAGSMLKAARNFGLDAHGYRMEVADLEKAHLPAIIHWEFDHFLVVEKFTRRWVYLADSARGYRRVSRKQFNGCFTGIVLICRPGSDFHPGDARPSALIDLLTMLRGARAGLLLVGGASLIVTLIGFGVPVFTQVFIDNVLVRRQAEWQTILLWGLFFMVLLQVLTGYVRSRLLVNIRLKLSFSMLNRFVRHLISLPINFFNERGAGDLMARVDLNNNLRQLLSDSLITALLDITLVVLYFLLMLFYDLALSAIVAAAAVVNVATILLVNRARVNQNELMLSEEAKQRSAELVAMSMIETIKSSGAEDATFARWRGLAVNTVNVEQSFRRLDIPLQTVPVLASAIVTGLVLWIGATRVIAGVMTIGMVMAFQALQAAFLAPVTRLVSFAGSLQQVKGNWERIEDVLRSSPERPPRDPAPIGLLSGRIELKNITFGYNPVAPPLINNFNLTVEPGRQVALVGPSGAGKSTIAKLITGILLPQSGEVSFNGVNINKIDLRLLRRQIGIVNQAPFLFKGTIRDNISLWDEALSMEEIIRSAKDACIDEEIMSRPDGYDTMLEEEGSNLSGGQQQRVCIARGLAHNPPILLLDEATSSLDAVTEERVIGNLLRRGCTLIEIAHRLSTIRDADEIIVLDNGNVVERGTHEELLKLDGVYASLIKTG